MVWVIPGESFRFSVGFPISTRRPVPEGLRICVLQPAPVMPIRFGPALIISPTHGNGRRVKTSPRLLLVALLAVCGSVAAPAGAATAASLPGMVLTSATATLPPELTPLATGKRIQYLTTDA